MLLDDFLQGIYATDLAEDEIITHVCFTPGAPGQAPTRSFRTRRAISRSRGSQSS